MKILVGLGNPGRKYERTRHNIGFMVLDLFAQEHSIRIERIKHKALIGEGRIAEQKIILAKPQTYMNLLGESVREIAAYYNAAPGDLIIIYDDVDLAPGQIRIRKGGSAGTHNGMRSVIYQLQSDEMPRIRVGIGSQGGRELTDHVLGSLRGEEAETIGKGIERAVAALNVIIEKNIDSAMNLYNRHPGEKEDDSESDEPDSGDR
ncbi:MAG TPA: aminoacyl-tRNA hydrolase [Clostridiales bacterium]|nr:aminoacyl-tRNA hydrolase [Clostridiales bacterium]